MEQVQQDHHMSLEDGELSESSIEEYIPLQRPSIIITKANETSVGMEEMEPSTSQKHNLDDSDRNNNSDSESDEDEKKCTKEGDASENMNKRSNRKMMVRLPTTDTNQRARFKKYNIWTETLQEEILSENLQSIDFNMSKANDRNVENYDFSIKYRLNGENSLKRRYSDYSSNEDLSSTKRSRIEKDSKWEKRYSKFKRFRQRKSKSNYNRDDSSCEFSDRSDEPRSIEDLSENIWNLEVNEAAIEICDKLDEEKSDLIVRIIEVLGKEIPAEIFKETQRIEADGGMMIKNRRRRRTPGGVFLFLLKNDDRLSKNEKALIFRDDQKNILLREQKVQELKNQLCEQKPDLPLLSTRSELLLLNPVSNPPPSPVGIDQSPEYRPQDLNILKEHL